MFKDTRDELDRLEKELEASESTALPDPDSVRNTDVCDDDLTSYSEEVYSGGGKNRTLQLVAIALSLTAAILAIIAWWLLRIFGRAS